MFEKISIFIMRTRDFNGPDNIIKGLVQLCILIKWYLLMEMVTWSRLEIKLNR